MFFYYQEKEGWEIISNVEHSSFSRGTHSSKTENVTLSHCCTRAYLLRVPPRTPRRRRVGDSRFKKNDDNDKDKDKNQG